MTKGSTIQTLALTNTELQAIQAIVKILKSTTSRQDRVTGKQISTILEQKYNIRYEGSRIRKMINHIRIHKLLPNVIATSDGYYLTTDAKKIHNYKQSLIERANAILAVANTF
jgi:hypothetical protein